LKTCRTTAKSVRTAVASATTFQSGVQGSRTAYSDTPRILRGHQVVAEKTVGREVAGQGAGSAERLRQDAYETFVAESQKIAGLYTDLAKQTFKPIEGIVAKFAPASH